MTTLLDIQILKIFLREGSRHQGQPLYEVIINAAHTQGIAHVAVYRSCAGFGLENLLQSAGFLRTSPPDLPLVMEIVDIASRIDAFLPTLQDLIPEGSIIVQKGQGFFHLPVSISDIMTEAVATVDLDAALPDVVSLLLRREIKAVPVINENRVLGIITGGDLLSRANMPLRLDMQERLPATLRGTQEHSLDLGTLVAKDIMTTPAITLNMKATMDDALSIMVHEHVKRLPVLADNGALAGIVSRTDILKALSRLGAVAAHLDILPPGITTTAQEILYTNVPVAGPDEPLSSILNMLTGSFLRLVVIIDAHKTIMGIIHDGDMLRRVVENDSPAVVARLVTALTQREKVDNFLEGKASDVMQVSLATAGPEATLATLIDILVESEQKRLVIADHQHRLLGVVDRDMLLRRLVAS
jgi:CBS domain-containing protein